MRLLYILTSPLSAGFLKGQVRNLVRSGLEVHVAAEEISPALTVLKSEGARISLIPIKRVIHPVYDLLTVWRLTVLLRNISPDITVTIGPKAGLLGNIAAAVCSVPVRIQTKWGLRMETASGFLWAILYVTEWISAALSHITFFDGDSARKKAISLGIVSNKKAVLIGNGSANGIDHNVFCPNAKTDRLYRLCGTSNSDIHIGFVGRINGDKGLAELVSAWEILLSSFSNVHLAIIGHNECKSETEKSLLNKLQGLPRVHMLGQQRNLEEIFPALRVFLLPSHREGFGVVVLEAASCGVPTVGFDVTGMRDSVVNGQTGYLVAFKDTVSLAAKVLKYISDANLSKEHGIAGRLRVIADFNRQFVWRSYYNQMMHLAVNAGCVDYAPEYKSLDV